MIAEREGTLKVRDEKPITATLRVADTGASGVRKKETVTAAATGAKATLVNITGEQWLVHRTYGTYLVPACSNGDPFGLIPIEPRVGRIDFGDKREFEFPITAREIADDIAREINSDAGEASDFGVFVCAGEWPTDEEVAAARARMETFYKRIVVAADQEWERSHNSMMISDVQRRAARWLKLERKWFYEPARQAECPACGEHIRPGVAVCRTCGAVLDRAKAAQFGLATETQAAKQGSKEAGN